MSPGLSSSFRTGASAGQKLYPGLLAVCQHPKRTPLGRIGLICFKHHGTKSHFYEAFIDSQVTLDRTGREDDRYTDVTLRSYQRLAELIYWLVSVHGSKIPELPFEGDKNRLLRGGGLFSFATVRMGRYRFVNEHWSEEPDLAEHALNIDLFINQAGGEGCNSRFIDRFRLY